MPRRSKKSIWMTCCERSRERGASDLHLTVGLPPMLRIDGSLLHMDYKPVGPNDTQRLVYDILTNEQVEKFERTHELDFSYGVRGVGRFRVNVYRQRGSVGAALRSIPDQVPTFEQLGLPSVLRDQCRKHSGLILVTGPTGSGKSTTIACMIDTINSERPVHISHYGGSQSSTSTGTRGAWSTSASLGWTRTRSELP